MLDHLLIYKGSNMGNSHRHAHEKVPVMLVGGVDGTFKGNRHLVFPDNTQRKSNMLLSILDLYGIHLESSGQHRAARRRSKWSEIGTCGPLRHGVTPRHSEDLARKKCSRPVLSDLGDPPCGALALWSIAVIVAVAAR